VRPSVATSRCSGFRSAAGSLPGIVGAAAVVVVVVAGMVLEDMMMKSW
jgi:hypothetical protein